MKWRSTLKTGILISGVLLGSLGNYIWGAELKKHVATSENEICPLLVGAPFPKVVLQKADASSFDLHSAITKKPTLLVYYRGSW